MKRTLTPLLIAALLACCALAPTGASASAPAWTLSISAQPSNFAPGQTSGYVLVATNVGSAPTSGTSTLEVTLPKAWNIFNYGAQVKDPKAAGTPLCTQATPLLACEISEPVEPGRMILAQLAVEVPLSEPEATLEVKALVKGGGAGAEVETTLPTPIQAEAVPPGILPGFVAPLTGEDGEPATLAGSHPYQQTIFFGFPTENPGDGLTNDGHPRDFSVELPRGLIGNPTATPILCTEAQLTLDACPTDSQVGVTLVTSVIGEAGNPEIYNSPLYNMVAPPGSAASLATNIAGIGIYPHILAGVRSEGDYGVEATVHDTIAFGQQPIFNLLTQIWGTPTAAAHDAIRGLCLVRASIPCAPDLRTEAPFLTLPTDCPGSPLPFGLRSDTWEKPSPPFAPYEAFYESADLSGAVKSVSGCNQLDFSPTISAQPTTNLTDSPSGLDVRLHQPQADDPEQRSGAHLKDARVTLPAGMTVNPSQASGLAACSETEIGYLSEAEGIHFSREPSSCPAAAKLGTVEVTTPLLAQYTEGGTKLATDPETGEPIPRALHGSVYLAAPFENPLGSLLAIYLTVEDPRTGTYAKLTGEVNPDPQTGQLTTVFEENPQLPIEDIELHLFGGARGALITPPNCATHTTTTTLTPWSEPEGADAHPTSSFQATASPDGGPCPASAEAAPNAPAFSAGTVNPQAGAYSPFVLKLSREDGSQRLTGFDTVLPPGLTGKLAGIPACSDGALAQAASRSNPEEGILERNAPSCPVASALGTVNVAAGAGPTPYYTQGIAYLAGPYKGAPLSMAVITPAIAGPFDLGVVVVRAALHLDRETTQIHAISDPFPTILHGIPLDLRSVAVKLDRPSFTLNPTSCDPMAITGGATSVFGSVAPLKDPFQVGGCPDLPFKPKLSLTLKGSTKRATNPRLIANLKAKPGEANVAKAQVKLPKAAFLDNNHIKTICTRVQFAADTCPAGSIYGEASATTPLLDYEISGPVYLRSSSNLLPDLVVKLKGPVSQPIEVDLVGRTDSVKGALRNTFTAVPDAPVSSFHLELFGGKRGLVELSSGLCRNPRATVKLDGQNGKVYDTNPVVRTSCKKGKKKGGGKKGKHSHRGHR